MKKSYIAIIVLLAVLLLTACGGQFGDDVLSQTEYIAENYYIEEDETQIEHIPDVDDDCYEYIPVIEPHCAPLFVYADNKIYAYQQVLNWFKAAELEEWEVGWRFFQHDVNQDGIQELFLIMEHVSGHVEYTYIYSFRDGAAIQLEFEGFLTDGAMMARAKDSSYIVMFLAIGSGGAYLKMEMVGDALVTIAEGFAHLSEEGFEREMEDPQYFWPNHSYEWYVLTIGGDPATVEEFEYVFGARHDRMALQSHAVTEATINAVLFDRHHFTQYEGTILMSHLYGNEIILTMDSMSTSQFIIDGNTLVLSDMELEAGMQILIYYETLRRADRLLPALAVVLPYHVAPDGTMEPWDGIGGFIGEFDENMNYVSASSTWHGARLTIGQDVEILYHDGTLFEGELYRRPLFVAYDSRLRYTFPQVIATRIYVLSDHISNARP